MTTTFNIISSFRLTNNICHTRKEITTNIIAIIKTGGKQFSVEAGQTLRVPSISDKKEGDKIDIEALL